MASHTAQNHSAADSRHFLACCLKTSVRTAQNHSVAYQDNFGVASGPQNTAPGRSGPLKTSSRQLQDDFGTTSEPPQGLHPDRKTVLSRTTQNQLGASSRPLLGFQAATHRSEPLKTASKPARDTAQHRSEPARGQLETSSNISEAQLELCMECTGTP